MFRRFLTVGLVALLSSPVFGQTSAFEIADVRVSEPALTQQPIMRPPALRDGLYEIRNATMLDLIRTAYGIEADKILGGPNWLELDRFDIRARVPAGTTTETARPMLRALLSDRFKLVAAQDTRQMTTWVLSPAAGGAKMLRAQSAGVAPSCQGNPDGEGVPRVRVTCRSMPIATFIEMIPRAANSYGIGTITDATNMPGPWDFEMAFTQNKAQLQEPGAIPLFVALEKDLGLKLEQKAITASSLTVTSVNRTPTPNAPAVAKAIPPIPAPEFEVVDIKPSEPSDLPTQARILPTGQINAVRVPLRDMINIAYAFNGGDMVVGPKFIDTARYDITGKAFSGADAQIVDDNFLRMAVQKMLADRFGMKFHWEERTINAYALVAGPAIKMTKADPNTRTRCYNGVPPGAKDPRQANPSRGGILTCENATMEMLGDWLRRAAGGYVQTPVTDLTGLKDGYTFTLNWSAIGMFPGGVNGVGARAGGAGAAPAIPTGAITLPEAVESQLGVKLEMGKRPVRVMVIDSINEKPSEN